MDSVQSPGEEHFQDRSRWLKGVGILEILIGALCGLGGLLFWLLTPWFRQMPTTAELARSGMVTSNVLAFAAAAALFVWLGVGTMRARRWARDLMLVAAWVWLIVGAFALVLVFMTLPGRIQEMSGPGQGPLTNGEIAVAMAVLAVVVGFLYVVLPGLFVLFYSGRNVRKTFESRDPSTRWTGKCPLSVLTLCQFLACCAIMSPVAAMYTDTLPVGRTLVTGVSARLVLLALALLYVYLTWAVYKLKVHAWWLNLGVTLLSYAWFVASYRESGLEDLVLKTGLSSGIDRPIPGRVLQGFVAALGVSYLVFLLLIKNHFHAKTRKIEQEGK